MASLKKLQKLVLEHLDADEEVLYSVYGAYETKIMGTNSVRNGAFFATSMRLVFYAKKLTGFDLEVFPYENISSIEMGKGLMGHHMSFFASGNKVKVKWINKGDIKGFVEYVKSRMGKRAATQDVPQPAPPEDIPKQISKLAQLMEQGILSEEEFNAKKKELLTRM